MRYIDNPELFSVVEMLENADAAYDADDVAYAAAKAAADDAYAAAKAEHWLSKYFKDSDENKQDYINEVERLK